MPTNPNPARISAPLWWLITKCTDLTPTSFVDEHGGVWAQQPGSHSDAAWLKTNRPNDYSLRGAQQMGGPQQYGRAWDWTFPSAQAGNYDAIVLYSARLRAAWDTDDPRAYPIFEALCEADYDYDPEGYVFYPERSFRVPDRTHKWHIHLGVLTAYIDNQAAMEAIWSILSGETLAVWQERMNPSPTRRKRMLTLYFRKTTGGLAPRWALAGGTPGWVESGDQEVANGWAQIHGLSNNSLQISPAAWNDLKAQHSAPVLVQVSEAVVVDLPQPLQVQEHVDPGTS